MKHAKTGRRIIALLLMLVIGGLVSEATCTCNDTCPGSLSQYEYYNSDSCWTWYYSRCDVMDADCSAAYNPSNPDCRHYCGWDQYVLYYMGEPLTWCERVTVNTETCYY